MGVKKLLHSQFLSMVFIIISICLSFANAHNPDPSDNNLIFTANEWRASTDPYGSSHQYTGSDLKTDGVVGVTFIMAPRGEHWPYVELICDVGSNIPGTRSIEIEYRSTHPLITKLRQSDLTSLGNAHYEYTMPKSESWKSTTVDISLFEQPPWASKEASAVDLNLEKVYHLHLVPRLNTTDGDTGTIEIRKLVLHGHEPDEPEQIDTTGASRNMLFYSEGWRVQVDRVGSAYDFNQILEDSTANVTFYIAQREQGGSRPYGDLICQIGRNLEGVRGMQITYKCQKPLEIVLIQTDFGYSGDQSYAYYRTTLPSASDWSTRQINISRFKQPNWASPTASQTPLKLENVSEIAFSPEVNVTAGDTVTLEVKSLILFGYENTGVITPRHSNVYETIRTHYNNTISIRAENNNPVNLQLYSLDGKIIMYRRFSPTPEGYIHVPLTGIPAGTYLYQTKSGKDSRRGKFVITP
ncbi:hypothetical protein CHISP_0846 [Chitinispirillum alkaliphilum]|nr:hypothetical protein CHISP_0846 [Chitinispirillum alkaliphilum]